MSASRPTTRPLARSMIGWKWGRMRPWERNSGNQSVRARSSSVAAGSGSPCGSARRTANSPARSACGSDAEQRLEPVVPAGPGQREALDRDVPAGRLRQVLDLVEHGGAMRQESHTVRGVGRRGAHGRVRGGRARLLPYRRVGARLEARGGTSRPRAPARPARRRSRSASARTRSVSSSSDTCVSTSRRAPARRPCSPASAAVMCPRGPDGLGLGQRRLDEQQVRVARELAQLVRGRRVGPEGEAARAVRRRGDLHGVALDEVRHDAEAQRERADVQDVVREVLPQVERRLHQVLRRPTRRPPGGTSRARPPGRAARAAAGPRPGAAARRSARRRTGRDRGSGPRAGG